jgi:aryl-alcohol dehydrogenase-like predicted oxidoreductase
VPSCSRILRWPQRVNNQHHGRRVIPAQLALAWLPAQAPWIVPIPGTTKLHRLEENAGAASVVLSPEDLNEIELVVSSTPVRSARYSANRQRLVGR